MIGGFIGNTLGIGDVNGVNFWSIVLSVVGAIVLLIVLPHGHRTVELPSRSQAVDLTARAASGIS